jgi:hypothetical protein
MRGRRTSFQILSEPSWLWCRQAGPPCWRYPDAPPSPDHLFGRPAPCPSFHTLWGALRLHSRPRTHRSGLQYRSEGGVGDQGQPGKNGSRGEPGTPRPRIVRRVWYCRTRARLECRTTKVSSEPVLQGSVEVDGSPGKADNPNPWAVSKLKSQTGGARPCYSVHAQTCPMWSVVHSNWATNNGVQMARAVLFLF